MTTPPPTRSLFLHNQQLVELVGNASPESRRPQVCGAASGRWKPVTRDEVQLRAGGHATTPPHRRVGLVCDAGLGKTTNMQWLAAHMANGNSIRQLPILLRLDSAHDLDLLQREHERPGTLLNWMSAELTRAAGGDQDRHVATLTRWRTRGCITLLLDGLDHALSQPHFLRRLHTLLNSAWRECPVWVSGRPYAFDQGHTLFFADTSWHFVRVKPLAELEIRTFLRHEAGGDWYDDIEEGRELLTVPRLLRIVADILRSEVAGHPEGQRHARVKALKLHSAADVYDLAYFTPGDWHDPANTIATATPTDRRGLLASGLIGEAASIGLSDDEEPDETNYQQRITRTGAILGAIAFEMFAAGGPDHPAPNLSGISGTELGTFKDRVSQRLRTAGLNPLGKDFARLVKMNIKAVDFLLFRELGEKDLVWHDRTVQVFFASHWVTKFGSPDDRSLVRNWIVDGAGKTIKAFEEFWRFAARLPDRLVDDTRWLEIFNPCYEPPQVVIGSHDKVQWHRQMIYHSSALMEKRYPATIARWRASFNDLKGGSETQRRIYREIVGGFREILPGICPFGADSSVGIPGTPLNVHGFRLHQWPVTNEMYETFDPHHRNNRWRGKHPLNDDRCPVVNVTWYDAWCFASWCWCRLPKDLEWEHACRAGSSDRWYFGNNESDLWNHAWHSKNSHNVTHTVGEQIPNKNGLFDLFGNAYEWCFDRCNISDSDRMLRGGCCLDSEKVCHSLHRNGYKPHHFHRVIGFRLAADPLQGPLLEPGEAWSGAKATKPGEAES